jgi:hypothetical protein
MISLEWYYVSEGKGTHREAIREDLQENLLKERDL